CSPCAAHLVGRERAREGPGPATEALELVLEPAVGLLAGALEFPELGLVPPKRVLERRDRLPREPEKGLAVRAEGLPADRREPVGKPLAVTDPRPGLAA